MQQEAKPSFHLEGVETRRFQTVFQQVQPHALARAPIPLNSPGMLLLLPPRESDSHKTPKASDIQINTQIMKALFLHIAAVNTSIRTLQGCTSPLMNPWKHLTGCRAD